jgi:hypothetical protein
MRVFELNQLIDNIGILTIFYKLLTSTHNWQKYWSSMRLF